MSNLKKQVGRPRSFGDKDLLTIEEAIERLRQELGDEKPPFARRTILNKYSTGELTRHGTYRNPKVDWTEFRRLGSWKKTS